jgi:hypothetical protein
MVVSTFVTYRQQILGLPISAIWRGHGSTIFLEIGQLYPVKRKSGENGNPTGEYTVMLEWSWRIESQTSIIGGSWSDEEGWQTLFNSLLGRTVLDISVFGRLPELSLVLSGEKYVLSFMTAEGQPSWSVLKRVADHSQVPSLCVVDGKLVVEG